jgi:hypothetical protein
LGVNDVARGLNGDQLLMQDCVNDMLPCRFTFHFLVVPSLEKYQILMKTIHLCVLQTISVLEPNKLVDTELLGLYAMLMAAIGAAGKRMLK